MESLPEGLEKFIPSQFQTVIQVEMLCYFYNHRGIAFSSDSLCQFLSLSGPLTLQTLAKLKSLGYVSEENAYFKYIDKNHAEERNYLGDLVEIFETQKSVIVEILFNSFMSRER